MTNYTVRRASIADADALVSHRIRMFEDMDVLSRPDEKTGPLARAFRAWLEQAMADGSYVAWLVEASNPGEGVEIVSGGGATLIPWPPGPRYLGMRLAFVYNVYTEPAHRRRGLARKVMAAIHDFCRAEGIGSIALNASTVGQPLYESLGYRVTESPMMFLSLT